MGDNNTIRPKQRWVSPVKELGCSSPRIRDESQQSAKIADERRLRLLSLDLALHVVDNRLLVPGERGELLVDYIG